MKHIRKIKKGIARFGCGLVTAAMVAGSMTPAVQAAAQKLQPEYIRDGDKIIGIKEVEGSVDGGTVKYYDIFDGGDMDFDITDTYALAKKAFTAKNEALNGNSLLQYWAQLAETVFSNNRRYCSNTSINDFIDHKFDDGPNADISNELTRLNEEKHGDRGSDYVWVSGFKVTKSLNDVRQKAAEQTAWQIKGNTGASDILKYSPLNALKDTTSSSDVYYTLLSCQNRQGKSFGYEYQTFGLAFYDISFSTMSSPELKYVTPLTRSGKKLSDLINESTTIEGVQYIDNSNTLPVTSYYKNESGVPSTVGLTLTESSSESAKNTFTSGKSYSFAEHVGAEAEITETFGFADLKTKFSLDFTTTQVLQTAYSKETSVTHGNSETVSTSVVIPAMTEVELNTKKGKTEIIMEYDCPVIINYKVAMFALSGECYDDNAWCTHYETVDYAQSDFTTLFGYPNESGGTNAMTNLRKRIKAANLSDSSKSADLGFESHYGQTHGHFREWGYSNDTIDSLKWKEIVSGYVPPVPEERKKLNVNYYAIDPDTHVLADNPEKLKESTETAEIFLGHEMFIKGDPRIIKDDKTYVLYTGDVLDGNGVSKNDAFVNTNNKSACPYKESQISNIAETLAYEKTKDKEKTSENYKQWYQKYYNEYKYRSENLDFYYVPADSASATAYLSELTPDGTAKAAPQTDPSSSMDSNADQNGGVSLAEIVNSLAFCNPMSSNGGSIAYTAAMSESYIGQINPIKELKRVRLEKNNERIELREGDKITMSQFPVIGLNEDSIAYYGFDGDLGCWELVTVKEQTDSEEGANTRQEEPYISGDDENFIARLETDTVTGHQAIIAGNQPGVVYAKYKLPVKVYRKNARIKGDDPSNYTTDEDLIETAYVMIHVSAKKFDGTVVAEGTYEGHVGDAPKPFSEINSLNAYAQYASGAIASTDVVWEARQQGKGIEIAADAAGGQTLAFTAPGTYEIHARYTDASTGLKYYSNWITVSAKASSTVSRIEIEDPIDMITEQPILLKERIFNPDQTDLIDLSKLHVTKAYDQNGDAYTEEEINEMIKPNLVWYVVDQKGKQIFSSKEKTDAIYGITSEGEFKIKAGYMTSDSAQTPDVVSNDLALKVLPARELVEKSFTIQDEAGILTQPYILHDKKADETVDLFDLSSIVASGEDQYVDDPMYGGNASAWKFDSPDSHKIIWQLQTKDGKEVAGARFNGNTMNVEAVPAGEYQLCAIANVRTGSAQTVMSNTIPFTIRSQRQLNELTIADGTKSIPENYIYNDKSNQFSLSALTYTGYDQYKEEEGAEAPEWFAAHNEYPITWHLRNADTKEECENAVTGTMMTVPGAGNYELYATAPVLQDSETLVTSNSLTLVVNPKRVLTAVISSEELSKGLGIGEAYKVNVNSAIKIEVTDQYNGEYDPAAVEWIHSGTHSRLENEYLIGEVLGSDTIQAVVQVSGFSSPVETNLLSYNVINKAYVAELYTIFNDNVIEETDVFDLSNVSFIAKDQRQHEYKLSEEEKASITWELTNEGSLKNEKGVFLNNKTLQVESGALAYGQTGTVILRATFVNANGKVAVAENAEITVKQKPVIEKLYLSVVSNAGLNTGDVHRINEFLDVEIEDQYGKTYKWGEDGSPVGSPYLEFVTTNGESIAIENTPVENERFHNRGTLTAGTPDTSAGITAKTEVARADGTELTIESNEIMLGVQRVKRVTRITLETVPEALAYGETISLSELGPVIRDDRDEVMTEEDLAYYPATVSYTMTSGETGSQMDNVKGTLTAGNIPGWIEIKAMVVNAANTSQHILNGSKEICEAVRIYIGPKVNGMTTDKSELQPQKDQVTVTLTGSGFGALKVALFDENGMLIYCTETKGSTKEQKAVIPVPDQRGSKVDQTYQIRYSDDAGMSWKDSPVVSIVVKNKPAPAPTPIPIPAPVPVQDTMKVGDTCTDGLYDYCVTEVTSDGRVSVAVTGFAPKKSASTVMLGGEKVLNGTVCMVTSVADNAFKNNKKIRKVVLSDGMDRVGKYAFAGCKKLTKCQIGDTVTYLSQNAFYQCKALKSVEIGKNVAFIGNHCFCKDKSIRSIMMYSDKLTKYGKSHIFRGVKKAKVSLPKNVYKKYKKLFAKKGLQNGKYAKIK